MFEYKIVTFFSPEDVSEKQEGAIDWKQGTSDIAKFYFFGEVIKGRSC